MIYSSTVVWMWALSLLCSWIGICNKIPELAAPPLVPHAFTDKSRFTLSTCGRCTACKTIQQDWFGAGSVRIWGGIFIEQCTENCTLTVISCWDEIFELIVTPYSGAMGPDFSLVHHNARPHVRSMQTVSEGWRNWYHWLAPWTPLNQI